jgi:pimeloyl-ACP methyl ester carboxylesterase
MKISSDLKALNIQVLIVEADNDPLVEPQLREMLKKTYPTAKVETLHALGHFPYLNEPRSYARILENFFQNTKYEKPNT